MLLEHDMALGDFTWQEIQLMHYLMRLLWKEQEKISNVGWNVECSMHVDIDFGTCITKNQK